MEAHFKVNFVWLIIAQLASNLSFATSTCEVDVAFLVDSSGSIGHVNYQKEKSFVKETASLLGIPSQSRGAVIVFGTEAELHISFNQAKTQKQFEDLVQNIRYMSRGTRIDRALILAAQSVFPQARPNVVKIALVITDGKLSQMRDTLPLLNASQPLREHEVRVLAVGIGSEVNKVELEEMVENPSDVFLTSSFDSLKTKVQEIVNYTCNIKVQEQTCLSVSRSRIQDTGNVTLQNISKTNIIRFLLGMDELDLKDKLSLKKATFLLDDLFNTLQENALLGSIPRNYVMCCVFRMEEFSLRYAEYHLRYSSRSIVLETDIIVFQAKLVRSNNSGMYAFPSTSVNKYGAMVLMPTTNYTQNDSFIVSILYKNLHVYLQEALNIHQEDNIAVLGTKVMSVTIQAQNKQLVPNVILRFETLPLLKSSRTTNQTCVFWDFTLNEDEGWSKEGCTVHRQNEDMTECSCNHLTHFAVLMQIRDETISVTENATLSVITYIGLGISLLGCALTLFLYFAFVNVRAQLSQIRINLVVSIAIGQIVFIAGIDATQNLIGCVAVATFIQYFYLVAFCWMLVEGVQLYLHIVKVFNIEHGMAANYFFAWGFPLIVVTATIIAALTSKEGAAGYVHEKFCWLSFKNKLAWTFAGPVLAITLINIILLLHVIREMSKMDKTIGGITPHLNIVRKTAKACAVLFPLLGITWVFGVLTMSGVGVAALYIFTILNSTQGFLIFLISCVRNSEIRTKLHTRLQSLRHTKPTSSVNPAELRSPAPCIPPRNKMVMTENKHRRNSEPSRTVRT